MRDILRYSGWRPGEIPILDQRLLEECRVRAQLISNRRGKLAAGCLSPRRHEALYYVAQGLENPEIAEYMVTQPGTIRRTLEDIFPILDSTTRLGASLKGIAIGALTLRDLVEPDEQDLLKTQLAGRKKDILDALIEEYGAETSSNQIGQKLNIQSGIVKNYLYDIMQETGISGKTRLAIVRFSLDY